jgi:hypothetical protein
VPATASFAISASYAATASYALNVPATASFAVSASYATNATTALSSSYAATASYTPNYLPLTGGVINGNLQVIGTASFAYVTASIVSIGTNIIVLNTNNPSSRFGGITVIDSGSFGNSSTGSLLWDSQNNKWIYSNPSGSTYDGGMLISGPRNTSGLGNETGMTSNFVAVGQGSDHIQPGTIFNSGSITQVTGSLTVTQGVTGSFLGDLIGTSSWSRNSISSSYSLTSSYSNNSTSASYSLSSSYTVSASYAATASHALKAPTDLGLVAALQSMNFLT